MEQHEWLAEQFEDYRSHLRAVAYRMLGSMSDADDAVQASWLRLSRSDTTDVENMGGWLTTIVARVCLDMLRSRRVRREESLETHMSEPVMARRDGIDPENEALLTDDSVGLALMVILDTLDPAERLSYVLHDMFAMPFEDIAPIVGRSSAAARQLASRARRQMRGTTMVPPDLDRQRQVVAAFLDASRAGNFEALLALLDPDVVFRADSAAVITGSASESELRGSAAVATHFNGRARVGQIALVNDAIGTAWVSDGQTRIVFNFTIVDGKIVEIELIKDADHLSELDVVLLSR